MEMEMMLSRPSQHCLASHYPQLHPSEVPRAVPITACLLSEHLLQPYYPITQSTGPSQSIPQSPALLHRNEPLSPPHRPGGSREIPEGEAGYLTPLLQQLESIRQHCQSRVSSMSWPSSSLCWNYNMKFSDTSLLLALDKLYCSLLCGVGGFLLSVGWLQCCVARGTSQSIPLNHILQAEDGS